MREKNYKIVKTADEVIEYVNKHDVLAYDTETTGLNVRKDQIVMISLSGQGHEAIAWPIFNNKLERLVERGEVTRAMQVVKSKHLVTHNFLFDAAITLNDFNIDLRPSLVFDTMLAYHTFDEEGCDKRMGNTGAGLKVLAQKYLGETTNEQEEMQESMYANGGRGGEFYKADTAILGKYACMDTDFTYRLYRLFVNILGTEGTLEYFLGERIPTLTGPSYSLNHRGIAIDFKLNAKLCEVVKKHLDEYEDNFKRTFTASGEAYNLYKNNLKFAKVKPEIRKMLNIPRLTNVTIEQIEDAEIREYLKSGGKYTHFIPDSIAYSLLSCNSPVLGLVAIAVNLRENKKDRYWKERNLDTPWVAALFGYKKFHKQASTYVLNLKDKCEDGIFYPKYSDNGTVSGRYSGNMQQLPSVRDSDIGMLGEEYLTVVNSIRKQYVARPGYIFLDADYESLEPHLFADLSEDPKLLEVYQKGLDYHSHVAIMVEGLEGYSANKKADNYLGKLKPEIRAQAKKYSLGVPYGLTAYTLSKEIKCTVEEAEEKIKGFYRAFPTFAKWRKECIKKVELDYKINIRSGNIRHFNKYKEAKEYRGDIEKERRKTYNAVINVQQQSLGASIVNRASVKLLRKLQELDVPGHIVANTHDQVVVEILEKYADGFIPVMQDILENTTKLKHLKLKAKPVKTYNLAEGH